MADRPSYAVPSAVGRPLRIAVSYATQLPVTLDARYRDSCGVIADLLSDAGHDVRAADPPYGKDATMAMIARSMAGIAIDADGLSLRSLERRSRPNVLIGRAVERTRLHGTRAWTRYRQAIDAFFGQFDLLLTPTLAAAPAPAVEWSRRGWVENFRNVTWSGFTPAWNVAGNPAAALPVAVDDELPPSVQLVADHGGEGLLLSVCQQIEQLRPWQRHPPDLCT